MYVIYKMQFPTHRRLTPCRLQKNLTVEAAHRNISHYCGNRMRRVHTLRDNSHCLFIVTAGVRCSYGYHWVSDG